MLRKIKFVPENYYHIFNRGTEKRNIFLCETDYLRFLVLLYLGNNTESISLKDFLSRGRSLGELFDVDKKETLVDIGVYCLMPNHFHLLIKEKNENGIPIFLKKVSTAYAMYFNKKNERTGNLFQGRFKAELADSDEYLKYLFAYIHLNPVKLIEPGWKEGGIKNIERVDKFLKNYQWSSYLNYLNKKNDPILNKEVFPGYFETKKEFKDFISDWLNFKRPEDRPRDGRTVLGTGRDGSGTGDGRRKIGKNGYETK